MMTKILTWIFSIAFMVVMAVSVQAERLVPDKQHMTLVGIQVDIGPDGLVPAVLTVADVPISLSIDPTDTKTEGYGGNTMVVPLSDFRSVDYGINILQAVHYINQPKCIKPPEKIPL